LLSLLAPRTGERILDAGCGMGAVTARIAESGALVTGLEILPALLEQARFAYPKIEFVNGDLLEFSPAQPFDAVFAHAVLHWVQPPNKAAKRIFGLLRPGGRLAVSLGGVPQAAKELGQCYLPEPRDYEKVLKKAGFRDIVITQIDDRLFVSARRPA
jgi:trans-aconitate methyltransferase